MTTPSTDPLVYHPASFRTVSHSTSASSTCATPNNRTHPSELYGPVPLSALENRLHKNETLLVAKGMSTFDPKVIGAGACYKILIGTVVPRPIAWVSTIGSDGVVNAAPFSFFQCVCANPPCLMVSCTRQPDGSEKDTSRNIRESKEFVVNTVSEFNCEQMNATSATFPHGVSEMEHAGLTSISSIVVAPPRIAEAAVSFECKLYKHMPIGEGEAPGAIVFIGEIVRIHAREGFINPKNFHVDLSALKPISRLAGNSYGRTLQTFDMTRPP